MGRVNAPFAFYSVTTRTTIVARFGGLELVFTISGTGASRLCVLPLSASCAHFHQLQEETGTCFRACSIAAH